MARLPRVGDQFGRYRIDTQIGHGGMGVVFGATDTTIQRTVALKVVSAALGDAAGTSGEFQRRFEREAALLARLNSPHVIAIYDYGNHDGCPYIATQYVAGGDLGALITARGPMPPRLATRVCAQVADALHDAHRAGVVHRDVKPGNVLLRDADTTDLHAYLCDFGIARTDTGEHGLTAPGSVSGTWSYLAPESAKGIPGTPASDVYALGCLLWTTLTGRPPYLGTDVEIAVAHQRAPVPQLEGEDPFTVHANAVLARSLAKDPTQRYADADRMRSDLLAAAGLPSSGVRPVPQPEPRSSRPRSQPRSPSVPALPPISMGSLPPGRAPTTPPTRRRTAAVVALACAAVVAIAGGVLAATQLGQEDGRPSTGSSGTTDPSNDPSASDPTTAPPTGPSEPAAPEPADALAVGDRDGDGFGDLAIFARDVDGRDLEIVFRSTGTEFEDAAVSEAPVPKNVDRDETEGDVDGDGMMDLILVDTRAKSDTVTWRVRLATGAEPTGTLLHPRPGEFITARAGDVDGDGLADLVLQTWGEGVPFRYSVALGTGAGFSEATLWLGTRVVNEVDDDIFNPAASDIGDFDGDGRTDLVLLKLMSPEDGERTSRLEFFLSDGTTFVSDGKARSFGDLPVDLQAGDLDGDGDDELAFYYYGSTDSQPVSVIDYRVGGTRPQLRGTLPRGQNRDYYYDTAWTLADVDGDNRSDLVGVRRTSAKQAKVDVALSNGRRWLGSRVWGSWGLDKVDTQYLTLFGSTFP